MSKVTVYDAEIPCHTNGAIAEFLDGFGIEIWNWIRVDLPRELIAEASCQVGEISLHRSGNQGPFCGEKEPKLTRPERMVNMLTERLSKKPLLQDLGLDKETEKAPRELY
ncbi:hypothetical protein H634G_09289 [Metarhizium anisopliae BRIP 53293]|uniref:Uncharacterized protein n=1 Tax=Metarhizium anisopliae BRIP 53293 TaxID=1291518 RepID=A0A0D9NMZ3_METAN|nr:hypothetical protein H634G_09289 [Metarhizium anisopliae BRIP 53293]